MDNDKKSYDRVIIELTNEQLVICQRMEAVESLLSETASKIEAVHQDLTRIEESNKQLAITFKDFVYKETEMEFYRSRIEAMKGDSVDRLNRYLGRIIVLLIGVATSLATLLSDKPLAYIATFLGTF
jgi:hypothetical protein